MVGVLDSVRRASSPKDAAISIESFPLKSIVLEVMRKDFDQNLILSKIKNNILKQTRRKEMAESYLKKNGFDLASNIMKE